MSADDEVDVDERRPAAAGSPLASLRDRRDTARQQLHLDLAVPRYEPPVFVRFTPVTQARIEQAQKRHGKSKDADKAVIINAVLLADACDGVFEVVDGEPVSIDPNDRDGDWPRFDERLAALLGENLSKATDVIRALYFTDGDIIATASKLAEWSGYSMEDLEEGPGN